MSYTERLNTASYESPLGRSFSFSYQAVSREISHRVGSFEFPGINGTLHQDKGVSGEVYPLTIFIHGQNYDIVADQFLEATKEVGAGTLIHPRWGRRRVQILSCSQNEDLTKEAGQAVFVIRFQESLQKEFPETNEALTQQIINDADSFQTDAINNYADQIKVETLSEQNSLKQVMLSATAAVKSTLQGIVSNDDDIAGQFRGYINEIENNINEFVQTPFKFATSITSAIRVVAEVPGRIDAQLQGYGAMIDVVSLRSITDTLRSTKNALLNDELIVTTAVVGISESVNNTLTETASIARDESGRATITTSPQGFQTRSEVLAAVVYLRDTFVNSVYKFDEGQVAFQELTLAEAYIQAVESFDPTAIVTSKTMIAGLSLSFSLPAERFVTIDVETTLMNLCYEFYGVIDDDALDFFITTNGLSGDEIITIPKGKQILYYA